MFRTKIAKGFIMGLGLAMALSTAAFAENAQEEKFTVQITSISEQPGEIPPDMPVSSDGHVVMPIDRDRATVSDSAGNGTSGFVGAAEPAAAVDLVNDEMYQKQLETDRYLFADHVDEIAAKGITVTHTSPTNEYVEIGITPYNEENAEFIYQALGREKIKVVEGIQAVTFDVGVAADAGAAADGREIYNAELYSEDAKIVSAPVDDQIVSITADAVSAPAEQTVSAALITAVAAAAIILLGGILLITRRMKTAKR